MRQITTAGGESRPSREYPEYAELKARLDDAGQTVKIAGHAAGLLRNDAAQLVQSGATEEEIQRELETRRDAVDSYNQKVVDARERQPGLDDDAGVEQPSWKKAKYVPNNKLAKSPIVTSRHAVCYCTACGDYDHAVQWWVRMADDGVFGPSQVWEKCKWCGKRVDEDDSHYSKCFRCGTLWCLTCSNTVAKQFPEIFVSRDRQALEAHEGSLLADSCPYLDRGFCYAGKFCPLSHAQPPTKIPRRWH